MRGERLTAKQSLFVQEYLVDLNATKAAVRAGYSRASAAKQGGRNLRNPAVAGKISEAMHKREERVLISQDMVINELANIAFGDLRQVIAWGPDGVKAVESESLSGREAALVAEVAQSSASGGGSLRLKRYDKLKALELLMRHLGMLRESAQHSEAADLARAIAEGRKRIEERREADNAES